MTKISAKILEATEALEIFNDFFGLVLFSIVSFLVNCPATLIYILIGIGFIG